MQELYAFSLLLLFFIFLQFRDEHVAVFFCIISKFIIFICVCVFSFSYTSTSMHLLACLYRCYMYM